MATFRFELDHRPTRNKTYNLYLMVTVGKKRTKKKTGIQLKHIDDFNPSCKGNNWIRANVLDAKALNEQLRLMLVKAQETYNELEDDGEVSSARIIKTMDKEIVSPSFLAFARERAKEIEEEGGFRNMRKYVGLCNKLDAFRKKMRMHDITMEDLTVELLTKFNNFLHKIYRDIHVAADLFGTNDITFHRDRHFYLLSVFLNAQGNMCFRLRRKILLQLADLVLNSRLERRCNLDISSSNLITHNHRSFFWDIFSIALLGVKFKTGRKIVKTIIRNFLR